ncbi:Crp/Fnr family transcriptional regulator [Reyranella sp.]|uniref:Crp/Fnr family transcriptional regulator n=1 Tax=Reyranella sp. TaxID=1929291 RepID=UPI003BAD05F1
MQSLSSSFRIISLFEDLPDGELSAIVAACTVRSYDRDALILDEQDQTSDLFFILSGAVRISSVTATGREVIYTDIQAGAMFGEFSAMDLRPRSAAAVAMSDCRLARMPAAVFRATLKANSGIAVRLSELLVAKIRSMSERVFEISALAVRERVRRELLRLAAQGSTSDRHVIIKPAPTHYEIASRIGSHREAVTREFNRLQDEMVIEIRRREICILDMTRLSVPPS